MSEDFIELPFKQSRQKNKFSTTKVFVLFSIFSLCLLILYLTWRASTNVENITIDKKVVENISKDIYIDISGAVKTPGIYKMKSGDRVYQVIEKAKGLDDQSNKEWVQKKLNLAKEIFDQQKIYIPFEGEETHNLIDQASDNLGKVNLNVVSSQDLVTASQLSISLVNKIIDSREKLSGFQNWAELDAIEGIGEKTLDKLQNCCYIQN